MRNSRAVALTALVAASAMVMAACGSSPGQTTTTSSSASAASSASTAASSASGSTAASSGSSVASTSSSGTTAGAFGAGNQSKDTYGCGTPHGAYTQPAAQAGSVTTGSAELASSWNINASHDNSVYNSYPSFFTQAQPYYYDAKLNLVNDDSFITCTVTSKSPLTVKYSISPLAKWSDDVPVTADDLLLTWLAESGKYDTGAPTYDKNGNLIPPKGGSVVFDDSVPGLALITQFPTISADDKTITFVYSQPFVDYALNMAPGLPAHVVAEKALGISDPTAALKAMVAAAKTDNKTSLGKIANFWNTGFDFTSLPSDKSLYLSDGAYLLTGFKANQYMTFTANPDYTWGPRPSIQTITYTYQPDPTSAIQAMSNGELQIIEPEHPTVDLLKGLKALSGQGVNTYTGPSGTYEHVDLVFTNGGPFDPKTYGGNATKALEVREAFLKTIPRQSMMQRLIVPVEPSVTLKDSFIQVPGTPAYAAVSKVNGLAAYDSVDIAGAKALLAQAGVSNVKVRLLYSSTSTLRAGEYQLMAQSAALAGITLVDGKDPNWSSDLTSIKQYDASLFAWSPTSLAISSVTPQFLGLTGTPPVWGSSNYGQYNNAAVNADMTKLNITSDPATQAALETDTEKHLVADAFGTVLYQYPDIVGFDSTKVTGVSSIPLSPGVFFDYWDWKLAGS